MSGKFDEIMGCGKISLSNIYKLIDKTSGASKYEILTYIYLSQIADRAGKVAQFTTKDLAAVIHCDPRSVFVVLKNMEKKNLIKVAYYQEKNWSGVKDIRLIGNDFSNVANFKKHRYISSFYPFFDFSDEENVTKLNNLSLYALRLLLLLLSKYRSDTGLKISYNRLRSELQLEKRSLIHGYLLELESLIGKDFFHKVKKDREIYGILYISVNTTYLIPEKSPREKQLSYYKRHWLLLFKNHDMTISRVSPLSDLLNYIFTTVYTALSNDRGRLSELEEKMLDSLQTDGGFIDFLTLYHASVAINGAPI